MFYISARAWTIRSNNNETTRSKKRSNQNNYFRVYTDSRLGSAFSFLYGVIVESVIFSKSPDMDYITTTDRKDGKDIKLAYSDYGTGDPVILIHGWPLSREMWEHQLEPLVNAGCRVIKYDRRGFGKSSKPWDGYDYDTLSSDLNALIEQLNLRKIT